MVLCQECLNAHMVQEDATCAVCEGMWRTYISMQMRKTQDQEIILPLKNLFVYDNQFEEVLITSASKTVVIQFLQVSFREYSDLILPWAKLLTVGSLEFYLFIFITDVFIFILNVAQLCKKILEHYSLQHCTEPGVVARTCGLRYSAGWGKRLSNFARLCLKIRQFFKRVGNIAW